MDKDSVLSLLKTAKPYLSERFGVRSLALFGSTSRGEGTELSDIDLLVDFYGSASSKQFFGVQFYLEDLLGRPIDLVTKKALRPEIQSYVERDLVSV